MNEAEYRELLHLTSFWGGILAGVAFGRRHDGWIAWVCGAMSAVMLLANITLLIVF